jgi:hypothetical protein
MPTIVDFPTIVQEALTILALGKHSCKIPDRDSESAVTSRCLQLFAS